MNKTACRLSLLVVGLTLMMTSCLKLPVYRDTLPDINPGDPGYDEVVRVKFLGVGGFAIRRGDDAILTAPLYSNPSLGEVLGARLTSKANRIEQFHPAVPNVKAILVGHAHYDHKRTDGRTPGLGENPAGDHLRKPVHGEHSGGVCLSG